jgi:hypothetical protein
MNRHVQGDLLPHFIIPLVNCFPFGKSYLWIFDYSTQVSSLRYRFSVVAANIILAFSSIVVVGKPL